MFSEHDNQESVSLREGNKLVGYAIKWDTRTKSPVFDNGRKFHEVIKKGAFDLQNANVKFRYRHSKAFDYGDTASGKLTLREDDVGLAFELNDPSPELREDVEKALVTGMSVGFYADESEMNSGTRIVKKGRLVEISATPYPSYPQTSVSVREESRRKYMQRKLRVRGYIQI